jgi:CDP-paratose 2-epimerase
MKVLITGICGFVGSRLAETLLDRAEGTKIVGIDNLMRTGSEANRSRLRKLGVEVIHSDLRAASDFENLPRVDCVIDAAANPSVVAGIQQGFSSRQLFEHNLAGLVNILEYCKVHKPILVLLSSSRVYSISALSALPLHERNDAFQLDDSKPLPHGVSSRGVGVDFPTTTPVSLYGSMKLASEAVSLEYGAAFGFPVWIDRCGVLAGAGQFGTADQGIFSYWINSHLRRRPLRYLGFSGTGKQVRDVLHPHDLCALLERQIRSSRNHGQRVYTVGGGTQSSMSLASLNRWCDERFGPHAPESDGTPRPYDVPWVVMDNHDVERDFAWRPELTLTMILEEIAAHAEKHPDWLERSGL